MTYRRIGGCESPAGPSSSPISMSVCSPVHPPRGLRPLKWPVTRAPGMGGAFVAVASDSSATWWNPAGLAAGPFVDLSVSRNTARAGGDQAPAWRGNSVLVRPGNPPGRRQLLPLPTDRNCPTRLYSIRTGGPTSYRDWSRHPFHPGESARGDPGALADIRHSYRNHAEVRPGRGAVGGRRRRCGCPAGCRRRPGRRYRQHVRPRCRRDGRIRGVPGGRCGPERSRGGTGWSRGSGAAPAGADWSGVRR